MSKVIATVTVVCLLFVTGRTIAQPTPQDVANTVSNYWMNQEFTNLTSYVTNLYVSHSNYFPAILASEFHDYIFLGKIADASNKLERIYVCITNSPPQSFSKNFTGKLNQLFHDTKEIMKYQMVDKGRSLLTLQSNASPSVVRGTWGTELPPEIEILFYTPATNAP